jgi:UDP-N-acetylglucosamine diphosphorylase/glucosamine-1-phosphate N-acetyltransferase
MQFILCDPDSKEALYPFSQVSSFSDLRFGLLTIAERYAKFLGGITIVRNDDTANTPAVFINSAFVPDEQLVSSLNILEIYQAVEFQDEYAAVCIPSNEFKGFSKSKYSGLTLSSIATAEKSLYNAFDILKLNQQLLTNDILQRDIQALPARLMDNYQVYGSGRIIVEEGAVISGAFLNTSSGPIYIGKNVTIMEGACLRGPVAVLDNAVVKMGAKIYGSTLIGKKCVVGGEIKNSVFFDYSNKAHDGYIGDSVIGSWCNLGAGTSCSNLKNNAGEIHIWNPLLQKKIQVGKKCGVLMGDHTRTAINTSLNSGTVTGICCNIVKSGFSPKYITDFTWNVETGERYLETKMLEDVHNWMKMKNEKLEEKDKRLLLQHFYNRLNSKE